MADEALSVVQEVYGAFGRGDIPAILVKTRHEFSAHLERGSAVGLGDLHLGQVDRDGCHVLEAHATHRTRA